MNRDRSDSATFLEEQRVGIPGEDQSVKAPGGWEIGTRRAGGSWDLFELVNLISGSPRGSPLEAGSIPVGIFGNAQ